MSKSTETPKQRTVPVVVYRDEADWFKFLYKSRLIKVKKKMGIYLADIRINRLGITQSEVADNLSVSLRIIISIEKGGESTFDILMRLWLYYGYMGVLSKEELSEFPTFYQMIWNEDLLK